MPPIEFDWNDENINHLMRHKIAPSGAEQVILNRPIDQTYLKMIIHEALRKAENNQQPSSRYSGKLNSRWAKS
jgi:hypothetical protein